MQVQVLLLHLYFKKIMVDYIGMFQLATEN